MKRPSACVVSLFASTWLHSVRGQLTNVNATFGSSPAPFEIDVDPEFIALTKLKASVTRFPTDVQQPDFTDGPPLHNATTVRDYWVDEYDWEQEQAYLNTRYVRSCIFQHEIYHGSFPFTILEMTNFSPCSPSKILALPLSCEANDLKIQIQAFHNNYSSTAQLNLPSSSPPTLCPPPL